MDPRRKRELESRGWKAGTTAEFLGLTPEEERYIELKLALGASLRDERKKQGLTQTELATMLGSSQSRVAKMEACDPGVSIDLILQALLKLGVSNRKIARIFD